MEFSDVVMSVSVLGKKKKLLSYNELLYRRHGTNVRWMFF